MCNLSIASRIDEILKKHPEYYNHLLGKNYINKENVYVILVIVCIIVLAIFKNY